MPGDFASGMQCSFPYMNVPWAGVAPAGLATAGKKPAQHIDADMLPTTSRCTMTVTLFRKPCIALL